MFMWFKLLIVRLLSFALSLLVMWITGPLYVNWLAKSALSESFSGLDENISMIIMLAIRFGVPLVALIILYSLICGILKSMVAKPKSKPKRKS